MRRRLLEKMKRLGALLIAASMVMTTAAPTTAYASPDAERKADKEQALKEELARDSEKYPNGLFDFQIGQIEGMEGQEVELTVVRRGGTDNTASVELKALDVSAAYGRDYLMTVEESLFGSRVLEGDEDSVPLMEEYADSLQVNNSSDEPEQTEAAIENPTDHVTAVSAESAQGSSLAAAKAAQTGVVPVQTTWRELSANEVDEDAAEEALRTGEASILEMAQEKASVSYTLDFAAGEYKKTIKISMIDDEFSESQEQAMFVLCNANGAEVGSAYTASLNITDNEETEEVVFSMAEDNILVDRALGEVKVLVQRTSGVEQMAIVTVGTSAVDAVPGTDYVSMSEDLVFPAGMTEKEVTIELLEGGSKGAVSFYVGLSGEGCKVDEAANATLINLAEEKEEEDAFLDTAMEGAAWSDNNNVKKTVFVSNKQNGQSDVSLCTGKDLSVASEIKITWKSTEGSYTYEDGCDKKTAKGRTVEFYVGNTQVFSTSGDKLDQRTTIINVKNKGVQSLNQKIWARVKTTGKNRNAKLYVEKVEIVYPGYTFTIDNSAGVDSRTNKPFNTTNTYVEKIYSAAGSNGTQEGTVFQLGQAYINTNRNSVTVYRTQDKLQLSYSLNQSTGSTIGTHINGDRVKFKGWQLRDKNDSTKWSSTISKIEFTKSFLDKYSNYIRGNNVIDVRPVFEVQESTIEFKNSEASKGQYKGYNNNSILKVKMLDTIKVEGTAKTGYAVMGFSVTRRNNSNQYVASETVSTGRKDSIQFAASSADMRVDLQYAEPAITVKADPKGNNTEQGRVMYVDSDKGTAYSGDSKKEMVIKPVTLDSLYRILGIPNAGYLTWWRDGTLDFTEDGEITEKEQDAYKEYSSFTPISGDILTYMPTMPFSKLYYDFYPASNIKNPQAITGRVYLHDQEIFTGDESLEGVNGATVTVSNQSDVTQHKAVSGKQKGGNGYFELMDNTFGVYGYYLANISYTGVHGGTLNASYVCSPGMHKDLIIDTSERVWVESAVATKVIKDAESGKETEQKINNLSEINNGKSKYRLSIKVGSIPSIIPAKATLRFYNEDGVLYNTTVTDTITSEENGWFTLDFVPYDLGLGKGTRLTLQFEDSKGVVYFERETGIKLSEAIGTLDLINSFDFGGANTVIKLVGKIDSAFNLGWNGDFDDNDAVTTTTDEYGNTVRTISLGFSKDGLTKSKELSGLSALASTKAARDEELANLERERAKATNPAKQQQLDNQINTARTQKAEADRKYNDALANTANPNITKTTMAANVSVDVQFKFAMSFALDNETSQWYFQNMMLYAKIIGDASVEVEFATPIGITINLAFGAGGNGSVLFVIEQRRDHINPEKQYLSTMISGTGGKINIFDCDMDSDDRIFDASGTFEVNPYISIAAGAGLGGVIKVSVEGKAQFYMTFYTDERQNTGSVTLTASISVSVLGIGGKWPFASKNVPLFGSTQSVLEPLENQNYLYDSAKLLTAKEREYLDNRGAWNDGTAMGAASVQEDGAGVEITELQSGIYPETQIEIMKIDNSGKLLAVFLDDDTTRTAENAAAAYYSIYDGNAWSRPVILENDGTLDQKPVLADMDEHGILITWSTANMVFDDNTSRVDMANSLNIHGRIFNKTTQTMGAVMQITKNTTEDYVADVEPNVSYTDNKAIIYYTKNEYDVSNVQEGEMIGDVLHPAYSLMAYRIYDFASGEWKTTYSDETKAGIIASNPNLEGALEADKEAYYQEYAANWYGQSFLVTVPAAYIAETLDEEGRWTEAPKIYEGYQVVQDGNIEESTVITGSTTVVGVDSVQVEPKIIESDSITYNDISIFAYVVDYDSNLQTVDDRDIYMQMYDYATDIFSHPIMLTSDNVEDGNLRFVRVKNNTAQESYTTYLAYLSDGDIKALDISSLVKNSDKTLLKTIVSGKEVYYINKAADCLEYSPASVMVEGPRAEDADNSESAITGFDVRSNDSYVYFVWTQRDFTLADGVEEGTEEAEKAENQKVEAQVYASRVDLATGNGTYAVQITEGNGLNYDNIAFDLNKDNSMKIMATVSDTTVRTYKEFKAEAKAYNAASKPEDRIDIPTAEEYVPYSAADTQKASLVTLDVNCSDAYLAIEDVEIADPAAGSENAMNFTIKNEGLGTIENVKITVTDKAGNSLLLEDTAELAEDVETVTSKSVDAITIPVINGGEAWAGAAVYTLAADENQMDYTIKVEANGKTVAEETFHEEIENSIAVSDFKVEETEERNVFKLKATVDNLANRISEADMLEVTMTGKDGMAVTVATLDVPELAQGESVELETEFTIDSEKLFVTNEILNAENERIGLNSVGEFIASVDGSAVSDTVERYVSEDAYSYVEAVKEAIINDGKDIVTNVGEKTRITMNIKSSLANAEKELTGTEGLQVMWVSEKPEIAEAYNTGYIDAKAEGTTTLYGYIMPKNTGTSVHNDTVNDTVAYEEIANYTTLPDEAILMYSAKVMVGPEVTVDPPQPDEPELITVGSPVEYNGGLYEVTKAGEGQLEVKYVKSYNKKASTVSIPAVIVVGKSLAKVTSIAADAFSDNKYLKKVVIGKNVETIGKNAFRNTTKLKTVTFKGTALKKIGVSVFEGAKKLKKITIPKNVTSIGKRAFYNCTSLKNVSFKTGKKLSIGKKAFRNNHRKAVYKVNQKYIKTYKNALKRAGISVKAIIKRR